MIEAFFAYEEGVLARGNQAFQMAQIPRKGDIVRIDNLVYLVTRILWANDRGHWHVIIYVDDWKVDDD